jgi:hypothetical protein
MKRTLSKYLLFQAVEEHVLLVSSRVGEMIVLPHNTWAHLQAGAFDALTAEDTALYYAIQPTAMCQLCCHYCGQQHTNDYVRLP